MINYKEEQENEIIIFKMNEQDDKELNQIFVDKLNIFFQNFILAIDQENTELLNSLLQESIEIAENKKSSVLPSFCFDFQIANSFIKSFQSDAYQILFKYSIYIFQNIYISNYCANVENFIPTNLLMHLWDCISFANAEEIHLIIQIIKDIMGQSEESWIYFHRMIRSIDYFKKLTLKIDDPDYIDLLREYVYFLTKKGKTIIDELEANLCYFIILDIFERFNEKYEKSEGKLSEIENYEFEKETILKIMISFQQIVSIDRYFFRRRRFFYIINIFISYKFLFYTDLDIYCNTIRLLSFLCDKEYRPVEGKYTDTMKHIKFLILEHIEEADIFTKLLADLNEFVTIPDDSPYSDIPGHLCNIITEFSNQINDRNINQEYLYNQEIYYSYSYHQLLAYQSIYAIVHVLENRDFISKTRACKAASFILDGPLNIIIHMLNLKVIPIIATFLESDNIPLISITLDFYYKLAYSFGKRHMTYPVQSDMEECNLIGLLDSIIFVEDDENRYVNTIPLATTVKELILQNIFQDQGDPNEQTSMP